MASPSVCVILHMFNFALLEEFRVSIGNLDYAGIPYDIFIAVPSWADTSHLLGIWPRAVVVHCEDRGFDIASFFTLLQYVLPRPYEYVLKLHSKSDPTWRHSIMHPLIGSPDIARQTFSLIQQPHVGMVGSKAWLLPLGHDWGIHNGYARDICATWRVPMGPCEFIGGTVFWARLSIFRATCHCVSLPAVVASLNTDETLDWRWYILRYPDLQQARINTPEQALEHWHSNGMREGRACNVLNARKRGINAGTDGMIEHAYERFFGLLVRNAGLTVVGV